VGDAADVHELHEDAAASRMNGVGDFLPRGNLFRRVDRRRPRITDSSRSRRGALGDEETGRGALAVVLDRQIRRHSAGERPAPRHRRHEHPVAGVESIDSTGREQINTRHSTLLDPIP
jgi:hypothetical protein